MRAIDLQLLMQSLNYLCVYTFSSTQMIKEAAPELTASSSEAEEEKEEHPKVDGERDPDFSQVSQ